MMPNAGRWQAPLRLAACGLALLAAAPGRVVAQDAAARPADCGGQVSADRVLAAGRPGELALASGRTVKLADIRLPEAGAPEGQARERALAFLGSLAGVEVAVRAEERPDRWGRHSARMSLGGASPIDVAELLVAEGLARVDPGERDGLCRADLLAVEETARTRRTGLWGEVAEPLATGAPDALRAAAGRFVTVQGTVLSVGERAARTYLNFGRDYASDFAVVIPRRAWRAMASRGLTAASLKGATVRIRGTIEVRRGPVMEIEAADVIERVGFGPSGPEAGPREPPRARRKAR